MSLFQFRVGVSPEVLSQSGGEWEPECHFIGKVSNLLEISAIQGMIDRYGSYVVAYYEYNPAPNMFSLEIQFNNADKASALLREYEQFVYGD